MTYKKLLIFPLLSIFLLAGCDDNLDANITNIPEKEEKTIFYVHQKSKSKNPDGTSWKSAFKEIQPAIDAAEDYENAEVWVAKGTYYPTKDDNKDASIELIEGIEIYGGFLGKETEKNQRDVKRNATKISGDIGKRGKDKDNSKYAIIAAKNSVIDGFALEDITTERGSPKKKNKEERMKNGLKIKKEGVYEGYTLFSPYHSDKTFLIDNDGNIIHSWKGIKENPATVVYLKENGNLIRAEKSMENADFSKRRRVGTVAEYDWEGNKVWSFEEEGLHHDIEPMPNGNILMIGWEKRSKKEAIKKGRKEKSFVGKNDLHSARIIEVDTKTNEIVWEWKVWDHLIQDINPKKENYGVISEHPERVNVNFYNEKNPNDWLHVNAIDYNEELDQIMISVRSFSEFWIIDHSTTTEEAASSKGGKYKKGGDLLFRWGNPRSYNSGTKKDQRLFQQHDAKWIPKGFPGEGNIHVYNNGMRKVREYSTVVEMTPPLQEDGNYDISKSPKDPLWEYTPEPKHFSKNISGAERLPNGNTLINHGPKGQFIEVNPEGERIWEFQNPFGSTFRAEKYGVGFPGFEGKTFGKKEQMKNERPHDWEEHMQIDDNILVDGKFYTELKNVIFQ